MDYFSFFFICSKLIYLFIFKIIIKLIMTSSRFDPSSTSVRPQKPWTSLFYGSMNGPGLKTLHTRVQVFYTFNKIGRDYAETRVQVFYLCSHNRPWHQRQNRPIVTNLFSHYSFFIPTNEKTIFFFKGEMTMLTLDSLRKDKM